MTVEVVPVPGDAVPFVRVMTCEAPLQLAAWAGAAAMSEATPRARTRARDLTRDPSAAAEATGQDRSSAGAGWNGRKVRVLMGRCGTLSRTPTGTTVGCTGYVFAPTRGQ
jgi:hypothetical protein